jgi:DNA polymerase-3 subunit gamma/tau
MRDLIVSKSGGLDALLELPDSLKKRYKEQADRCPLQFLYDGLGITTQCESGYRASVNPRLHIEFALMRLAFIMNKPAAVPQAAPVATAPTVSQERKEMPAVSEQQQPQQSRPAAQPEPAAPTPQPAQQAPAVPATPVTPGETAEPRERRTRAARSVAGLSMKAVMDDKPVERITEVQEAPAPSEDSIRAMWPKLAQQYNDKPRLASMLSSTTLTISSNDDSTMVVFRVVNEAQKDWVESKLLHDLEGNFRKILGSLKVYLRVEVTPDDSPQEKKIYMPSEQAEALMAENAEVKSLIKDLELDIK